MNVNGCKFFFFFFLFFFFALRNFITNFYFHLFITHSAPPPNLLFSLTLLMPLSTCLSVYPSLFILSLIFLIPFPPPIFPLSFPSSLSLSLSSLYLPPLSLSLYLTLSGHNNCFCWMLRICISGKETKSCLFSSNNRTELLPYYIFIIPLFCQ